MSNYKTSPSDCIFIDSCQLKIHPLWQKVLKKETRGEFKRLFTKLNQNHRLNTGAATKYLAEIPQKKTCHYGSL